MSASGRARRLPSVAAPVQLIFQEQQVELPAAYALPQSLDLEVASVIAFIDGGAAAESFKVALSVYSQSGQLMMRVPTDRDFAAGDSGVVSWAPFLRNRRSAEAGADSTVYQTFTSAYDNSGGYPTGSFVLTNALIETNDPDVFDVSGGSILVQQPGVYLMYQQTQMILSAAALDVGGATRLFPGEASVVVEPVIDGLGLVMQTALRSNTLNALDNGFASSYTWNWRTTKIVSVWSFTSLPVAMGPLVLLQDPLVGASIANAGTTFLTAHRLGDPTA